MSRRLPDNDFGSALAAADGTSSQESPAPTFGAHAGRLADGEVGGSTGSCSTSTTWTVTLDAEVLRQVLDAPANPAAGVPGGLATPAC